MKGYSRLLEGKRVLVTTDVRNIGKDIALLFIQQGAQARVGGRNPESLAKTIEEIRMYSPESKGYMAELSSKGQVKQTVDQVLEGMQEVSILVSTVGISVRGWIDECSDGLLERVLETNYKSGFRFSCRFIPSMMERRYRIITSIPFIHGVAAMPGFGVYAGTKGAMNATARAMVLDYANYGIRVNTIYPGLTVSDNTANEVYGYQEDPERNAFMEMPNHMQPLAPGKVGDVSDAALCLVNDVSSCVAGQIIMVDGGTSVKAHQRGREDELS